MSKDIYCLWLMPETSAQQKLQLLIDKLALKYDAVSFSPHLTLAVTPNLPHQEKTLDKLIMQTKPFFLRNPTLTTGKLFTQSIYIRFEKSDALISLHRNACELIGIKSSEFYPHLSLIYKNLNEKEKIEILNEMNFTTRPILFDSIKVIKSSTSVKTKEDVEEWKTIYEKKYQ